MQVAFLGRGEKGLKILRELIAQDFDIPFIWTCEHTDQVGGSREEFRKIATREDIPFEYVESVNSEKYKEKLEDHDPDIAIAVLWMDIIKPDVLRVPEHGFLNQHAGMLPKYRGNAVRNWAILEDEDEMGITTHQMTPKIDAGPILAQDSVPITAETTVKDLTDASREIGTRQLMNVLEAYRTGSPPVATPQNEGKALRCYPRIPEYGKVDWTESAEHIDRHVRSLGPPYPRAYSYHGVDKIYIHETEVVPETDYPTPEYLAEPGHVIATHFDEQIWVATGEGILAINEISEEGTDPYPPAKKFSSIREGFGMNVADQLYAQKQRISELERKVNGQD